MPRFKQFHATSKPHYDEERPIGFTLMTPEGPEDFECIPSKGMPRYAASLLTGRRMDGETVSVEHILYACLKPRPDIDDADPDAPIILGDDERFMALLQRKDIDIEREELSAILRHVMEQYADRPTLPSDASANGARTQTSEAASSSLESTPSN